MNRVLVNPDRLRWARERARYSVDALAGRFPKIRATRPEPADLVVPLSA